jgi:hypothetical protein
MTASQIRYPSRKCSCTSDPTLAHRTFLAFDIISQASQRSVARLETVEKPAQGDYHDKTDDRLSKGQHRITCPLASGYATTALLLA